MPTYTLTSVVVRRSLGIDYPLSPFVTADDCPALAGASAVFEIVGAPDDPCWQLTLTDAHGTPFALPALTVLTVSGQPVIVVRVVEQTMFLAKTGDVT